MKKQKTPERTSNRSVGGRLTLLIIFMIIAISSITLVIGYLRFKKSAENYYYKLGETTAGIVSLLVDADSLDAYVETLATDSAYEATLQKLKDAQAECGAQALYLFRANAEGTLYIYDADPSGWHYELGHFEPYILNNPDGTVEQIYPAATAEQLQNGASVDSIIGYTIYGWTITVSEPLYGSDGVCKGYVGIDFNVNQMVDERMAYLRNLSIIVLIATIVFAIIYLNIIQRTIIRPINTMAKAANHFLANGLESGEAVGDSEILSIEINTKDELQSLATALQSMVRKIDEHITKLNVITIKSETDALTSLYNRGAFQQQVNTYLRFKSNVEQLDAFMMIDVDYFKAVNDNYGHSEGDVVLTECANALRNIMRDSDIVGRLGGDEFAVFCKSIGSVSNAEDKARKIREAWLKIIPGDRENGITASIGISFAPKNGQGYQELFNKADEALYKIKESGRDGFSIA
ncbi:sensor domain-containing diguanylate cyclase [Lachnospiraceae bacterium ZAX-1]